VINNKKIKLSEVCEITSSKRIYANEYINAGIPFFRGKEIVTRFHGGETDDEQLYISDNRFHEIKNKFGAPQKGDLLLTSVGTIGIPYKVSGKFDFYFKDGNLTWFRYLSGIDQSFLYYWLISPDGKAQLSKCTIGAAQPAYTIERLKCIEIVLPTEKVQRKIASIIESYDDLIENNRRRIQLLEDAARLLYREWFIYLRFPGHEHVKIVDGVPEGWHKQRLDDVAVINAESLKSNFQGRIEYIDISCVSTDSIDSTNWYEFEDAPGRARRILRDKDIIWSCVRPNRKSHAFIWQPHDRLIASTGFAVISAKTISPFFLYQTLSTSEYVGYLTNNAGGVAYPAVTAKVFEDSIILVPPNSITDTFDSFVSKSYQQINLLQQANKKLIEARDLLLPRLMSGEISV
jgi:type I restriction enzyme S subunit